VTILTADVVGAAARIGDLRAGTVADVIAGA
jgi:hypothetical protein